MTDNIEKKEPMQARDRRPWLSPELKQIGKIADLVQGGQGKLVLTGSDPGEGRKGSLAQ